MQVDTKSFCHKETSYMCVFPWQNKLITEVIKLLQKCINDQLYGTLNIMIYIQKVY